MSDVITSAGLGASQAPNLRRVALQEIRRVLRKSDATDAEVEDALESLVELAKDPDEPQS